MTRIDFGLIIAYLELGCGKPLPAKAQDVYFDLLGDLPAETLQLAARRVLMEHKWATFPTIAELRQAASETTRSLVREISAAEAWALAWRAAGRMDPEIAGSVARHLESLPQIVREAMQTFGVAALVCGREPLTVVRAQFTSIYDQIAARDRRLALFPPALCQAIERHAEPKSLPAPVLRIAESIGHTD